MHIQTVVYNVQHVLTQTQNCRTSAPLCGKIRMDKLVNHNAKETKSKTENKTPK